MQDGPATKPTVRRLWSTSILHGPDYPDLVLTLTLTQTLTLTPTLSRS